MGMLRKPIFQLLTFLMIFLVWGCQAEKGYFPSGEAGLRFSTDTVRFDTVFSTIGSTTAWLSVYNPQNQTVLIDTVYLRSQGGSGYRISVDAMGGYGCRNLEIPSGDSVFVFVELTAAVQHSKKPVDLLDEIVFQQGTAFQKVVLKASVQDAEIWKGKVLDANTTMTADIPYIIYDSLVVNKDILLEINAGSVIHFHDGAMLKVHGTVQAEGTTDLPVVFRGDRLDRAFTDFYYDSYPGQWFGVYLAPESTGNVFTHSDIHGAYYGIIADSSYDISECKLRLYNSKVSNMIYSSLYNLASRVEVHGSILSNSGSYTVVLIGGATELIHCTIANYQTLVSREESSPALAIVNYTGDVEGKKVTPYPLLQADITNTVIYGSQKSEVGFGLIEQTDHNIRFHHALLRLEGKLDESLGDSIYYNEDPKFLSTGANYVYDFHTDTLSAVACRADTVFSTLCPLDMDGRKRISSGKADLGAYSR